MILPFLLNKKTAPVLGITKPSLIIAIGQSNEVGTTADAEAIGWLFDNHPEYFGRKTGVKVMTNVDVLFPPGTFGVNQFIDLAMGINNGGANDTDYEQSIDRTMIYSPIAPLAVDINARYNQPVHYLMCARGGTTLTYTIAGNTWHPAAEIPDNFSLFRKSLAYIDIAFTQMDSLYGIGNWDLLEYDWNQGEQGPYDTATYEANEWLLYNAYIAKYGSNFEFVSSGVKGKPLINDAKILNAAKSDKFHYFSTVDLDYSADGVHYTAEGHYIQSQRSFDIIKTIYG